MVELRRPRPLWEMVAIGAMLCLLSVLLIVEGALMRRMQSEASAHKAWSEQVLALNPYMRLPADEAGKVRPSAPSPHEFTTSAEWQSAHGARGAIGKVEVASDAEERAVAFAQTFFTFLIESQRLDPKLP